MSAAPPGPTEVTQRINAGAFLLIDKPRGPSSHQVTAWVRDLLRVERAGHAGTLDPNVSGLLWVGVGRALKLIPLVLEFSKRYVGVMVLHGPVPAPEIERVASEFQSAIFQTPPVRSAVKRERRIRRIHRLSILEIDPPRVLLDVTADSGTYLRTLAVDLGEALGTEAHLEELRRVGTGPFREDQSITVTELEDALERARTGDPGPALAALHPLEEVWQEFPKILLKEAAAAAVAHGASLARGGILHLPTPFARGDSVALVNRKGAIVAIGEARVGSGELGTVRSGWVVETRRVLAEAADYPPLWRPPSPKPPGAPTPHDL
ncbi:MAG: RNA-guided pseudouridylation complex pseudouridine synthase subunit Cbf5 [Thermoplasmata archaeon]